MLFYIDPITDILINLTYNYIIRNFIIKNLWNDFKIKLYESCKLSLQFICFTNTDLNLDTRTGVHFKILSA